MVVSVIVACEIRLTWMGLFRLFVTHLFGILDMNSVTLTRGPIFSAFRYSVLWMCHTPLVDAC